MQHHDAGPTAQGSWAVHHLLGCTAVHHPRPLKGWGIGCRAWEVRCTAVDPWPLKGCRAAQPKAVHCCAPQATPHSTAQPKAVHPMHCTACCASQSCTYTCVHARISRISYASFSNFSREGGDLRHEILSVKTWKNKRKCQKMVLFSWKTWKMVKYFISIFINFQVKIAQNGLKMG